MMKAHKFIFEDTGYRSYGRTVFCEYCGLVVFDGNNTRDHPDQYQKAKKGCPLAPDESREE